MEIRRLNVQDLHKYLKNIKALMSQTYSLNLPEMCNESECINDTFQNLLGYVEDESAIVKGIIENDELCAFIWVYVINNQGRRLFHLRDIVVDQERRGSGLGTILLKAIEEEAQKNEVDGIELIVTSGNEHALSFYNSKGFYTKRIIMEKTI